MTMALSTRGQESHDYPNFHFDWGFQALGNLYDAKANPQGIVNLGFAENTLSEELVYERMNRPNEKFKLWTQYYFEVKGVKRFRESLANFLTKRLQPVSALSSDNIIVTSGVGAAFDLLAHVFADDGDTFLCPAPHYSVIKPDVGIRCGVKCFPVQLPSKDTENGKAFRITRSLLENSLDEAQKKGHRVKGIVIVNPNNPTGDVYTEEEIKELISFSARHDIHLISDEIYALSVFDPDVRFRSVLSFDLPKPDLVHLLWGFSKDFCLAGYRCGVIHTTHPQVPLSARHLSYLAAVPAIVQQKLCSLIEDEEWIDSVFLPTNLARMKESYKHCASRLESLGVHVHRSSAAFFVWADFSKFLKPLTRETEIEFFKTLYYIGVYFTPGTTMSIAQPGWFRINFTVNREHLDVALDRLENHLQKIA